jgi:hypothetical protein
VEQAQQKLSAAQGSLLAAIQANGYAPEHAPKTTRLEGAIYIADATTASTVKIVNSSVLQLQKELSRLKFPKLFPQLFGRTVKYTLLKGAGDLLRLELGALKDEARARMLGIFATCLDVDSKTPSVSVNLVAALRQKEADAQVKAEAKAARAAKKAAKK